MQRLLFILGVLLCGCSSMPSHRLNMSLSELGETIESSEGSSVSVESAPTYTHPQSHVSTNVNVQGRSYYDQPDRDFGHARLLMNFRSALNRNSAPYIARHGLELALVAGDSAQQFRGAVHIVDADFNNSDFDAYNNPVLAGFDLDYHRLFPVEEITYLAGIRLSGGLFGYGLDSPVNVDYQEYNSDTLGYIGLGIPLGMQMEFGPLALEAILTPTVHLFSEFTDIGFFNDILQANALMPFTIGVGYAW